MRLVFGDRWSALFITACCLCVMQLTAVVAARADAPRTGIYQTSFDKTTPLADIHVVFLRASHPMGYAQMMVKYHDPHGQVIDPTKETWEVYVPEAYDGSKPYGVLVWVNPWDRLSFPTEWRGMLKEHHLIYVSAGESGNHQSMLFRRIPLALTGLENIKARYNVDPARIYIGGFSGGGDTAGLIAANYPDVFTGGIFVATTEGLGTDEVPVPPLDLYRLMQDRGRYVFVAGMEDPMYEATTNNASSAYLDHCVLRVLSLSMLNEGHRNISSRYLFEALHYLDSPTDVTRAKLGACMQRLRARRIDAIAAVRAALATGDRKEAESRLVDLHEYFGPLAEPEVDQLSACIAGSAPLSSCTGGSLK